MGALFVFSFVLIWLIMKIIDKKYFINVPIAGFTCQICFDNKKYFDYFHPEYRIFKNISKIDWHIYIKDIESADLRIKLYRKQKFAILYFPHKRLDIKYLLSFSAIAISNLIIRENILIIHASSLIINGSGYIFCGKRGAGKSTVIKLTNDYTPLSDDAAIIKKEKSKYYIYPSYLDSKRCNISGKHKTLLEKIFIIQKKDKTLIKNITPDKIMQKLLKNNFLVFLGFLGTAEEKNILIRFCLDLASSVPVQKLYFTKSREFLKLL